MKNERLLDVFGQIDDSFIMEAAPKKQTEKRTTMKMMIKKPVVFAAVLALCVCLSCITVFAATGMLQGFFADVFGENDAITGTTYEQATDELEVNVLCEGDRLLVELFMLHPEKFPYRELERFGIRQYQIFHENGNSAGEAVALEAVEIENGKITIELPVGNLPEGNYMLHITQLVGEKKADQPLVLQGEWESSFTK